MTKRFALDPSKTTALLGGTFDPPHLAHYQIASELTQDMGVSRLLIVPSAKPPHKPAQASSLQRLKMCEILFSKLPHTTVSDLEIKREGSGKPSYSIDTVLELKSQFAGLAFVIGNDQLEALPTWHRFQELLGLCDWIVLGRKPGGLSANQKSMQKLIGLGLVRSTPDQNVWQSTAGKLIQSIDTQAPELSSSDIRAQIALKGAPLDRTISPDVSRYLKDQRLYGTWGGT